MTVAIASALLHFLWQGALLGALAWLGCLAAQTPRARYLVGVTALLLMAAAPVATILSLGSLHGMPGAAAIQIGTVPNGESKPYAGEDLQVLPTRNTETRHLLTARELLRLRDVAVPPRAARWLTLLWLAGVLALSLRLAAGWLGARRLSRAGVHTAAAIRASADRLIASLGIARAVTVIESTLVDVPGVVGWLKPVVLLPAAAMSGLSIEQVNALLAHELAHVRRHDYVVNLCQSAIETVLFYHPAVWLVSRRVRQERELCCDDLALAVCGDRVVYASALAELEAMRAMPVPALAANGGSLLARVRRILAHDAALPASTSRTIAGVAVLALLLLAGGVQAAHLAARPAADETGAQGGVVGGLPGGVSTGASTGASSGVTAGASGGISNAITGGVTGVAGGVRGGTVHGTDTGVAGGVREGVRAQPDRPSQSGDRLMIARNGAEKVAITPTVTDDVAAASSAETPGGKAAPAAGEGIGDADQTQASVPADAIAPGQTIRLEVRVGQVRQADFNRDYTVQRDGTILVPYIGTVAAAGKTIAAVQSAIQSTLEATGALPGATVLATLEARVARTVSVIGGVKNPGTFTWRDGLTVGDALDMAGGIVEGVDVSRLDVLPAGTGRATTDAIPAGAVVKVPLVQTATVTLLGAVRNPGTMQVAAAHLRLADAINQAGGVTPSAGARVLVRKKDGSRLEYATADLLAGKLGTTPLTDGDTVTIAVAPRFFVNGYVKTGGDFVWTPDMTLEKAIALAGGLKEEASPNRISIERRQPGGSYQKVKLDNNPMKTSIQADDVINVPKKWM